MISMDVKVSQRKLRGRNYEGNLVGTLEIALQRWTRVFRYANVNPIIAASMIMIMSRECLLAAINITNNGCLLSGNNLNVMRALHFAITRLFDQLTHTYIHIGVDVTSVRKSLY